VLQSPNAASLPSLDPQAVLAARYVRPYAAGGALVPSLHNKHQAVGAFGLVNDSRGSRHRVSVVRLDPEARLLAAYHPLNDIDESVSRFGQLMLMMAVVGAAGTFGMGWLVAGRVLRPVAILTDTAGTIARSQEFSRRVPVQHSHDELGRLARTFNEMLASLGAAYGAQQRFVADASHELRAPLTVLQANLELLRHAMLPPEERERALQEAHEESERLARLVADLLVLARADSGHTVRHEPVEFDRVLMQALGEARHLTTGQYLEVGELEPLRVSGDPDRLRQLVLILVDNAIKYTPPPGRIVLGLRRDRGTAHMTVRDSGIGIADEALPHVFERFYRADPARSRDPGGTGLGLPIAQWIAGQHGGTVWLKSAVDHGTTAVVTLPCLSP
jgi:two-component system OmpR family sensor kinase